MKTSNSYVSVIDLNLSHKTNYEIFKMDIENELSKLDHILSALKN